MEDVTVAINTIDDSLGELINDRMCSSFCPCPETDAKPWTSMSEGDLNAYKRTKEPQPTASDEKDTNGNTYLVTKSDENTSTVKSYIECVE